MVFNLVQISTSRRPSLTNEEFLIKTDPYDIDMLIFESAIHLKYFVTFNYHIHIHVISKHVNNSTIDLFTFCSFKQKKKNQEPSVKKSMYIYVY